MSISPRSRRSWRSSRMSRSRNLKGAQGRLVSDRTPPSRARLGWFKIAKSCGATMTCSPTCGRRAGDPNQLSFREWATQSTVLDAAK